MRQLYLVYLLPALFIINNAFSQPPQKFTFTLTGKIIGRDTGVVFLNYSDLKNIRQAETTSLINGTFKFTGTVNRVCDAYLWTDTSKHSYSDPSVVRFLLEPGNISIIYDNGRSTITGSASQEEKEKFEKEKSDWVISQKKYQWENDSLKKLLDMQYIRLHPDSYFSGFILSTYTRKAVMDTLQAYYSLLGNEAKSSSEGRRVIEYIYPLTKDTAFRNKNPILGSAFNKIINESNSIHDLYVKDIFGNVINFKTFKGQYLLIDFWASWCGPCLKNLPHLEKLMKQYQSYPIRVISVSLDTDSTDWKNAVLKNKISGVQFCDLQAFKGIIPVYCKVVTGIPRYVLVDKEGKIINYDAPQPVSAGLKVLLDKLLIKAQSAVGEN